MGAKLNGGGNFRERPGVKAIGRCRLTGELMRFHRTTVVVVLTLLSTSASAQVRTGPGPAPATRPAAAELPPPVAKSKLVAVTVYQGTALVTREVDVPEGRN